MFAHGFGGVSGCDGKISGAPLDSQRSGNLTWRLRESIVDRPPVGPHLGTIVIVAETITV